MSGEENNVETNERAQWREASKWEGITLHASLFSPRRLRSFETWVKHLQLVEILKLFMMHGSLFTSRDKLNQHTRKIVLWFNCLITYRTLSPVDYPVASDAGWSRCFWCRLAMMIGVCILWNLIWNFLSIHDFAFIAAPSSHISEHWAISVRSCSRSRYDRKGDDFCHLLWN